MTNESVIHPAVIPFPFRPTKPKAILQKPRKAHRVRHALQAAILDRLRSYREDGRD